MNYNFIPNINYSIDVLSVTKCIIYKCISKYVNFDVSEKAYVPCLGSIKGVDNLLNHYINNNSNGNCNSKQISKSNVCNLNTLRLSKPIFFDWKFYIENYPDLKINGINSEQKAIKHYILHGQNEKRIYTTLLPTNFDWKFYVNNYKDLKINGINTRQKAIEHYLLHGKYENRKYCL